MESITANLGVPFLLGSGQKRDLTIKRYPTCQLTHRALDAILFLVNEHNIAPDEVETVDCVGPPRMFYILKYPEPKTSFEGKFSMQFCMAIAILERNAGLAQVTDEKVNDPQTRELMKKISMRAHADWVEGQDRWDRADRVTVKLKNGKEYTREVLRQKGHATMPMSWSELESKFRECAGTVLRERDIQHSLALLKSLEKQPNLSKLMNIVGLIKI